MCVHLANQSPGVLAIRSALDLLYPPADGEWFNLGVPLPPGQGLALPTAINSLHTLFGDNHGEPWGG
jgi:hypothetical protein